MRKVRNLTLIFINIIIGSCDNGFLADMYDSGKMPIYYQSWFTKGKYLSTNQSDGCEKYFIFIFDKFEFFSNGRREVYHYENVKTHCLSDDCFELYVKEANVRNKKYTIKKVGPDTIDILMKYTDVVDNMCISLGEFVFDKGYTLP